MIEDRELKSKILLAKKTIEFIQRLDFNLDKEKRRLENITNGVISEYGNMQYKMSEETKLSELESLLKDLKEYDEYFKLLNTFELLKKFRPTNKLPDTYISKIIDFINVLRDNKYILDDTQTKRIKEIYKTLYSFILQETLYSDDFDSKILKSLLEDKYDIALLNEIITSEIENIRRQSYVDLYSLELLEKNILFLNSQGITDYARLEIITKLLSCIRHDELRERFKNDLNNLLERMSENTSGLSSSKTLIDIIKNKYELFKTRKKENKLLQSLMSFLLACSIILGSGFIATKFCIDKSKNKLYKVETTTYNDFLNKEVIEESWQEDLGRTVIGMRKNYNKPFWSEYRQTYTMHIETYDVPYTDLSKTYDEILNLKYLNLIDSDFKDIPEEEALLILDSTEDLSYNWTKEVVIIKQDKSKHKEEINLANLLYFLSYTYITIAGLFFASDYLFEIGVITQTKKLIRAIKEKNLSRKEYKFLSLEYQKVLKEYESYIKENQELSDMYQNVKRWLKNTLAIDQDLETLLMQIETKINTTHTKYNRTLRKENLWI